MPCFSWNIHGSLPDGYSQWSLAQWWVQQLSFYTFLLPSRILLYGILPQFVYPFSNWWASGLFPSLGNCEYSCYKRSSSLSLSSILGPMNEPTSWVGFSSTFCPSLFPWQPKYALESRSPCSFSVSSWSRGVSPLSRCLQASAWEKNLGLYVRLCLSPEAASRYLHACGT